MARMSRMRSGMSRTSLAAVLGILAIVAIGSAVVAVAFTGEGGAGRESAASRVDADAIPGGPTESAATPDYFSATFAPGQAIVSLRFDDGAREDYDLVYPLLAARGLHASFAVPYNVIDERWYLSLSQMRRLEAEGHEIVCHSMTHGSEPASFAEFRRETAGAKEALKKLGFTITSYSIPGTWGPKSAYIAYDSTFFGSAADRLLREHFAAYDGFVTDVAGGGIYRKLPVTGDVPYGYAHVTEGGIAEIDAAIARGAGIQLLWHSFALGREGHQSVAEFTRILDYVAAKVATGEVVNLTDTQQLYAVATPKADAALTPGASGDAVE